MWEHPAVQENLATLRRRGRARARARSRSPRRRRRRRGPPRRARAHRDRRARRSSIRRRATSPASRVLVTAGGTREPIDAVRVITQPLVRASRATRSRPPRPGGARASRSSPRSTARSRPASPRSCGSRPRPRWKPPSSPRAADAGRHRDGRGGRRLPPEGAQRPARPKKEDGPPEIVLEPTHDFLVDLGAAKPTGQVLVGLRGRDRRSRRPRRRQAAPRSGSTSSSATTSARPTPASRSTPTGPSCSTRTAAVEDSR